MKNTISFLTWKYLKYVMMWIIFTFFSWLLESIFSGLKLKLENMANSILIFISNIELSSFQKVTGILCLLAIFFTWLIWYLKEYKQSKKEYFDLLENSLIDNEVNIRYLQLQMVYGKDVDLLTIAENFSEQGMKIIGLDIEKIKKAKQYFKQKYGYEPNRDNKQVSNRT